MPGRACISTSRFRTARAPTCLPRKEEGKWNDLLLHALGGMRATMGESMLGLRAPCQQLAALFEPVLCAGFDQLGCQQTVRWRCGFRRARWRRDGSNIGPQGVDANPYLVAATILAAIRHGLKHRIDPGPETTGNGYEDDEAANIPRDWRSAIEAAQKSSFLKEALGEDMHRTFTAVKAAEYARVARTIADVDYDLYLHTV